MATRKTHKVRGATFETDLKDDARAKGYDAERLARTGAKDEGDVVVRAVRFSGTAIVEAKAPGLDGKIDLSGWTREAQTERDNYARARGIASDELVAMVVIKARGKSLDDAYVVMRWGDVIK